MHMALARVRQPLQPGHTVPDGNRCSESVWLFPSQCPLCPFATSATASRAIRDVSGSVILVRVMISANLFACRSAMSSVTSPSRNSSSWKTRAVRSGQVRQPWLQRTSRALSRTPRITTSAFCLLIVSKVNTNSFQLKKALRYQRAFCCVRTRCFVYPRFQGQTIASRMCCHLRSCRRRLLHLWP